MNKEELIKLLKKEYMRGLIKEDYNRGKNRGISIAVGLAEQLDEQGQVVCAENERTTKTVEIPEWFSEWIEERLPSPDKGDIVMLLWSGYDLVHFSKEEFNWLRDNKILATRAILDGYTIEPPKTLQVIVKNYDSTVYKTELPEDEAMKLIEGWEEDVK